MRKLVSLAALAVALLAPAAARGELLLGARVGWAVPAGQSARDVDLSATVSGALPVQLEAGWRFWRGLSIGVYGSYAFARIDTFLDNGWELLGVQTTGSVVRAGLRAEWSFQDFSPSLAPWVAAGTGWERASFDVGPDFTYTGWDLLLVEAGAEWKAGHGLAVGPFLSWSIGRYMSYDQSPDTTGASGSIKGQANHAWVTLGLRGTWGP